jgi:hypothetical protein
MAWSRGHSLVIWALGSLAAFSNAQAFFGGDQDAVCPAEYSFVDLGCFSGNLNTLVPGYTFAAFTPSTYVPGNPATTFPGFDPGSNYNNTVTPQNCVTACRGFGYRTAALFNGGCSCGYEVPSNVPTTLTPGTCDFECSGDSTQTCGGGSSTQVYTDPSFADPAALAAAGTALGSYSQYLGCFYVSNSFPTEDGTRSSTVQPDIATCLQTCAGLGYPLAMASYL